MGNSAATGSIAAGHTTDARVGRFAAHVGRIGALAVALGVGIAVTGSPAVAWAEPSGTSATSDTSPAADGPGESPAGDAATNPGVSPSTSPPSGETADERDTTTTPPSTPPSTQETTKLDGVTISSSGGALTSGEYDDEPKRDEPKLDEPPTEPGLRGNTEPASGNRPVQNDVSPVSRRHVEPAPAAKIQTTEPVVESSDSSALPTFAPTAGSRMMTTADAPALTSLAAPAPDPVASLIAIPVGIITAVVNTLVSPFLAPAGSPTQPPMIWAVLAWVRREIQTTFFNRRPLLAAPDDLEQVDRVLTGTVAGSDPDGDDIVYTATSTTGTGGTVAIDQQGGFTYTAPQSWDGTTVLTDTFTVTVSDAQDGFHFHGLAGLFFGVGHTSTREVSVALAPTSTEITATQTGTVTVPTSNVRRALGSDGTLVVTYRTGAGTTADPYVTNVTVLRPNRDPVTTTAPGSTGSSGVLSDGTAVVSTVHGSGTTADPFRTTLTVMRPGAEAATSTSTGRPYGFLFGNDDVLVSTVYTNAAFGGDSEETTVTVVRAGAQPVVATAAGMPVSNVELGANGTVALATRSVTNDISTVFLTVLRPGAAQPVTAQFEETATLQFQGYPTVGPDGTVAFAAGDSVETTVTVLRPGQAALTHTTPGGFAGYYFAIDEAGTVAYATSSGTGAAVETTLAVLRSGQSADETTRTGSHFLTQIADDIVVHQTVVGQGSPADPYQMTTTVLRPNQAPQVVTQTTSQQLPAKIGADGTVVVNSVEFNGQIHRVMVVLRPNQAPITMIDSDIPGDAVTIGADGTVADVVNSGSNVVITILRPGQTVATSYTTPGSVRDVPIVAADGTVAVNTIGDTQLRTLSLTVVRLGEDAETYTATGILSSSPTIGPDGVVYQLVEVTPDRLDTRLIVVAPSGESKVLTFTGRSPSLTIHEDGGATLAVSVTDAVTGTTTYAVHEISLGAYVPPAV